MKSISLIFAVFMMSIAFCGKAFAEDETVETMPAPGLEALDEDMARSSIFDIMVTACPSDNPAWQVDMAAYYMEEMLQAVADGNVQQGQEAEKSRNAAIDALGSEEQKISFDELYLLARVIYSEAGSEWLSEDFRLCVGEVVLNRVASPEFPDTIYDVVYQKGQYAGVNTLKFAYLKPGRDCTAVALKLLQGERRMVPAVVYHSGDVQGELFSMHSDRSLGNTYFCLSANLELYD